MNLEDPSRELLDKALEKGLMMAFAESVTAGNLTAGIVKHSGASGALAGGITAYSNDVKTGLLGVPESTLMQYGAVSEQTVLEMIRGLERCIKADIYAAVSGIAGPAGGSEAKPVGTVDMAFKIPGKAWTERKCFNGNREQIIKQCADYVYSSLAGAL